MQKWWNSMLSTMTEQIECWSASSVERQHCTPPRICLARHLKHLSSNYHTAPGLQHHFQHKSMEKAESGKAESLPFARSLSLARYRSRSRSRSRFILVGY